MQNDDCLRNQTTKLKGLAEGVAGTFGEYRVGDLLEEIKERRVLQPTWLF